MRCSFPRTSVLLLGDSITGYHIDYFNGSTLALWPREMELALSSRSESAAKGYRADFRYKAKSVCGAESGPRVTSIRTDFLSTRMDGYREKATQATHGNSEPWADAQLLANYGVVVVNSGAHHLADAVFEQRMEEAADFLEAHVPHPRVLVYRDTVPGHGDCMNLSRPFGSVDEAERWVHAHPNYSSATVTHQNAAAWRIFERHGFVRLNVYDMSVLRGDAHHSAKDCLHFEPMAAPSIYGAWNAGLALLLRDVLQSETTVARSHA